MDFTSTLNNAFTGSNKNIEMYHSTNNDLSIILAGNHLNEVNLNSDYDSGFCSYINQSTILAGNVSTFDHSNKKCSITRGKENRITFDENESVDEDNEIDVLNTNIDAICDQSEMFYDSLECKIDSSETTTESVNNTSQEGKLTPLIDVQSSEQSNGTFRVQICIKGFKEENKPVTNLKFKQVTHGVYDNFNKKAARRSKLANFNRSSKTIEKNKAIVGTPNFEDFDNKENYDPKNIAQFSMRSCINFNKLDRNCL
ncbi:uncharacterized protein LOC100301993 [Nasonia vitripennis]|uniref:Uncharacterized protein n=1 Tax=Nasonia vitripennis TaxID=7425 RepID=A0A7M6UV22_NASVI|nr:uncharacterized protein LOC100301993 [Nasonia vitripennis]